jgi:hypothetical protein
VEGWALGCALLALVAGGLTGGGCQPALTAPPPASPAAARPRVALIPIESNRYGKVAQQLNEVVTGLIDTGLWDVERPKIGIEDLQISIECIEATPACFSALAQSLKVDRLHFGRLSRDGKRQVKVTLFLFDAKGGRMLNTIERRLPSVAGKLKSTMPELEAMARESLAVPSGPPLLRAGSPSS